MVSIETIFLLSLIQGVSEFLPVSSSAHLFLLTELSVLPIQSPVLDVMAHGGSLMAVLVYLRREVRRLLCGGWDALRLRKTTESVFLGFLCVATLPSVVAGFYFYSYELWQAWRMVSVIAWANIVFALLLWASDNYAMRGRKMDDLSWRDALLLGLGQLCAFIPGASRAGVVVMAARLLGFARGEALRLSFLLALPVILGANVLILIKTPLPVIGLAGVLIFLLSFAISWLTIEMMMRWVARASFTIFVVYRLMLGLVLLSLF